MKAVGNFRVSLLNLNSSSKLVFRELFYYSLNSCDSRCLFKSRLLILSRRSNSVWITSLKCFVSPLARDKFLKRVWINCRYKIQKFNFITIILDEEIKAVSPIIIRVETNLLLLNLLFYLLFVLKFWDYLVKPLIRLSHFCHPSSSLFCIKYFCFQ